MRRLSAPGIVVPLLLAVVGSLLIVAGAFKLDTAGVALPSIPDPTSPPATQSASPSPSGSSPLTATPTPIPTPIPANWIAVQIGIASVGLNLRVKQATTSAQNGFPPHDAAYILHGGSQPGRSTNSYIFGHALLSLFKRLWNVQLGAEVKILMSDGQVLRYRVTEIHPNTSCPDTRVGPDPSPPLALRLAPAGCPGQYWTRPTDHERLTLQTSQGFNRNYGELIIVALPVS
jgi:Sortase family.